MTLIDQEVKLEVEPLSGSIGTVIHGVNLRELDDVTVAAIREVWLTRKVVFFQDNTLTRMPTSPSPLASGRRPKVTRSFRESPATRTSLKSTTRRLASPTPPTATSCRDAKESTGTPTSRSLSDRRSVRYSTPR